jgi:hypothetical protein
MTFVSWEQKFTASEFNPKKPPAWRLRSPGDVCLMRNRLRNRWQGKNFVELAVDELYRDLNPGQAMLVSAVDRLLGMLKIVGIKGIGRPIAQAAKIKLSTDMLQQDLHGSKP